MYVLIFLIHMKLKSISYLNLNLGEKFMYKVKYKFCSSIYIDNTQETLKISLYVHFFNVQNIINTLWV